MDYPQQIDTSRYQPSFSPAQQAYCSNEELTEADFAFEGSEDESEEDWSLLDDPEDL